MTHYYSLPVRMPTLSLLLKPRSLIITTRKQYTACTHGISAVIVDHVQAPELANTAQLSSRESYSAALQVVDGNGSDSGVGCTRCQ